MCWAELTARRDRAHTKSVAIGKVLYIPALCPFKNYKHYTTWLLDGFLKAFLQNISSQDYVLALFYVKASPATCQARTSM